jgi:probable phosphoglycerate mutase
VTIVALLRHAPTTWNREGRMQGHADIPASTEALTDLGRRKIPSSMAGWPSFSSPLRRAVATAEALGLQPDVAAELLEMDWGRDEGKQLVELRATPGFAAQECRGLDFRPEGGETPREAQGRVLPWLRSRTGNCIAVTHKGVIRAVMAEAENWAMTGRSPAKLDWSCFQLFEVGPSGVRPHQYNLPLTLA